jgi:hypothetical protein
MHLAFVTTSPLRALPDARAAAWSLAAAGHTVSEVRVVSPSEPMPSDGAVGVPSRVPRGGGLAGRMLRRAQPRRWREWDLARRVAGAAAATGATVFLPATSPALGWARTAAETSGGVVLRDPKLPDAGARDLIRLAPAHPELAAPVAGTADHHTPADERGAWRPEAGRHRGKRVVLAYRKTATNPGRYVEEALRRSGADVRLETESLDLATVDPRASLVLFVESPYPALDVRGGTDVPVLMWAHHGEHHLAANLRLLDRYRADALLLAHSWHLAPWSPVPVHRFPFAVPAGLMDPSRPLADRRFDVALVGSGLWGDGRRYGRRQELVAAFEAAWPADRLGFAEGVSPEEMADIYGDARLVLSEGGTRHFPITMRVFETVAAGAVLLTDDLPGLDQLLSRGDHYEVLGPDPVAQARTLLRSPQRLQDTAARGLEHVLGRHTYDHRVDELFEIAATTAKRRPPSAASRSSLAAVIDRDVQVQRVAQVGASELVEELPSRAVFDAEEMDAGRLTPGTMEAVAVRADHVGPVVDVLRAARRYLYVEGPARGLDDHLATLDHATVTTIGDVRRVDLHSAGYAIDPEVPAP